MRKNRLRIIEYQCKGNKSEKSSYSQERVNYPNILSQITDPVNKPKVVVQTKASKDIYFINLEGNKSDRYFYSKGGIS